MDSGDQWKPGNKVSDTGAERSAWHARRFSLRTVSAIDLALSWLILLLLLGLVLRAMLHFHRHSDLPLPRLGPRPGRSDR